MSLLAFRFLLFYIVILLVQPQNRFPILHPLHIADICVIGSLGLHFISASQEGRPIIRFGIATKMGLILIIMGLFSLYAGPLNTSSRWNPWIDILVKNALVMIMVEAMAFNWQRVWAVMGTIMLASLWWVKAGIRLAQAGATHSGDRLMGAAVSLIENPNTYAYLLSSMVPVFAYFFFHSKVWYTRILFLLLALSSVYIVFETGSRTGFLVILCLGVFMTPKLYSKSKTGFIGSVIGVLFILSLISGGNMERFKTIGPAIQTFLSGEVKERGELSQDEQSAQERRLKNRDTWKLVKRYPLFGVGINANPDLYTGEFPFASGQVHNEILAAGRQMGIPGMLMYAGFLVLLVLYGLKSLYGLKQWPEMGDLGWVLCMQGLVFVVGGAFSPLPWNAVHLSLCGCVSALWTLVKNRTEYQLYRA